MPPDAVQLHGRRSGRARREAGTGARRFSAGRRYPSPREEKAERREDGRQTSSDCNEESNQGQVTETAVRVDRLEKQLGPNRVLRGISFEALSGEIFGLLGPNGAGKTTTLRIISTLLAPDSGSVEVAGFDTRTQPQEVRRHVGVVTAEIGVYPRLTARENITYFAQLTGVANGEVSRKVNAVLDRLDMEAFASQRAESLSSGQKQKVAIARAIVHDPAVLMFDEPTSNLDVLASKEIREFMVESKRRGKCVIFSTHVLHDAERLCDRVTIIHEGRVVAGGATADVRGQFKDLEDSFLSLIAAAG